MVRARPRWLPRAALALALCTAASGCSLVLVDGPPEGYREMDTFSCTEGDAIPILDVLWATVNGIAAAQAWLESTTPDRGEIILLGSTMAVASGVSATIGFRRRSACRQARLEMARLRQSRARTDTAAAAPGPPAAGTTAWWRVPSVPPLRPPDPR